MVQLAREVVLDPTYPTVRAWTRRGRRAVGCFPVYTPQELVHAMGLLPVSLHGGGENVEISHADAALGSFLCSISKSTLELALTARLAPFRAFIFPYICDVSRNLEGIFSRLMPGTETHMLHLPQNFRSEATVPFLVAEYRRLIAKLERAGGEPYRPERLEASVRLFNLQRERIGELTATKRDEPDKLTLTESYLLRRLGGLLPREVHVELLDRMRSQIEDRPPRRKDAIRTLLVGPFCEQPTLDLIDLIEQAGCYIVDDELLQVHRWYGQLEVEGDPLVSLARAYVQSPLDIGVRAAPSSKGEAILRRVNDARAQGVIFLTAKFCEPALEDVVLYRRALDRQKIPYLHLEFEERSTSFEQSRLQLETFVESILFD
ncbi:benzoyl-CoA reductase, subunit C [mine drainage metagenome]|uniref:Benzoyl-CoA reductase, subunit C n=1 Tax=mine drainage metagenome TaxID=410659 RepID=T1CXG2_9ZZZZ